MTLNEFKMACEYLSHGIEHLNLNDLERGGEALGTALASIPELVKDCGAVKFEQDLLNAVRLMKSGMLKFLVKEAKIIVSHEKILVDDIKTIITTMKSGEYKESGVALGKILGILIQV